MGIGAAVLCLAAGAILYYAVEVDLPYVEDDTLGAILLLVGLLGAVVGVIVNTRRSQAGTSTGSGLGLFLAGAILYWAVDVDVPFVTDSALGVILMVAGVVTVAATLTMHWQETRRRRRLPPQPATYEPPVPRQPGAYEPSEHAPRRSNDYR